MRIMLAGASGLLGQALRQALTAHGDVVRVLVRREPRTDTETEWHPDRGDLDPSALRDLDAVVCLSGVNLGHRRWTDQFKRDIVASRVQPVGMLARTMAEMPDRPPVFPPPPPAPGATAIPAVGWWMKSAPLRRHLPGRVCRLWGRRGRARRRRQACG